MSAEKNLGATIQPKAHRALSLDALRGLAIVGMILSARIPFDENWLPGWMYHGQEGPNPLAGNPHPAGFTWVDLVFPAFLFAMGTAFPFALTARISRGAGVGNLVQWITQRYVLLVAFAIYLQHTVPYVMGNSTADHWVGFLAFVLLFPILSRFPKSWNPKVCLGVRIGGIIAAAVLLSQITYPDGSGFNLHRSDIIILVLANMALFGSGLWLLTHYFPKWKWALWGIALLLGLAGHASMGGESHITLGLAQWLGNLNATPISWLWQLLFLKYLFIVVPGMMVGDMLLAWTKSPPALDGKKCEWNSQRLVGLVPLWGFIVVFAHIGLKARWSVGTPLVLAIACALSFTALRNPRTATERLLARLNLWAVVWLIIGLVFEPFEGGIKKTPSTMSYYLISTALSIDLLLIFLVIIDIFEKRRWMALLISNGQNPMLAYAGIRGLLGPFYTLTGIDTLITAKVFAWNAWAGAAWGTFKTFTLAWVVHLFTRWKIFLRT